MQRGTSGRGNRGGGGRAVLRLLTFILISCLVTLSFAHPANVASALAKVAADGKFVTRIRFDISAFATGSTPKEADDGAMNALIDGSDEALRAALADAENRFRTGFISGGTIDRLVFPSVEDVRKFLANDPKPRLPVMLTATVEGHLPDGVRTISFRYPSTFDTVIQTVEFPYKEPISEPVERDRTSTPLTVPTQTEIDRLAATMNAPRPTAAPEVPKKVEKPASVPLPFPKGVSKPTVPVLKERPKVVPPKAVQVSVAKVQMQPTVAAPLVESPIQPAPKSNPAIGTYVRMGYTHILPEGIDHILFVLGLFLLGSKTKSLISQITAFTVAHSITLAVATLGIVRLPGSVIEPLIAASIAFVAIENLFLREAKPWRLAVVFLFGLVHGMGFAEVFTEAGLSGSGLIAALLSFNVGVELGQLSVVAIAFGALGWFRPDPRYRRYVVIPFSLLIAAVSLFWTVQRVLG